MNNLQLITCSATGLIRNSKIEAQKGKLAHKQPDKQASHHTTLCLFLSQHVLFRLE